MAGFVDLSRALAVAAALGGLALPAQAQTQTRYPYSLTLYDQPDYRGGSVTFYGDNANIGSTGFATRARSAQIRGTWRLCEGGGYRNRCEVLAANIRDLEAYGFAGRVGSAQLLGAGAPPPAPPAPYGPPSYAPPAYAPLPAAPAPPPAQPYRPSPYAAPAPLPAAPAYGAPYAAPAPAPAAPPPAAPAYGAPYASGPWGGAPETLPPAVDAPLAGPGRFGRPYGPPSPAPAPQAYAPPPYQAAPYPAAAAPPPYEGELLQGVATVFFPAPVVRGSDVSARAPGAADGFCRAQGLGPAVFFDQGQRLPRAVDLDGRPVGEGPVLRDVLCRR